MALRLRRGTDAERLLITPLQGELIYTNDTKLLYAGDGTTAGGTLVTGSGSTTLDALTDTDLTGAVGDDVLTYNAGTSKWEAVAVPGAGVAALNDLSDVFISSTPSSNDILRFDGVNFTAYPISRIFNEQQNYKINIVGDDSTIIVNTDNNNVTGNFIGNVTGDLTGIVKANDATTFYNPAIKSVNAGSAAFTDDVTTPTINAITDSGYPLIKVVSETNTGSFGASVISINNNHTGTYGQEITFNRSNGTHDAPIAATAGDYVGSLSFRVHDGNDYTSLAAMHVVADTVTGTDNVASKIDFYTRDGAIASEYDLALTLRHKGAVFTGYVQFGSYTTTERNAITAANGMVIYNTTDNKFQGYENGAWANLI